MDLISSIRYSINNVSIKNVSINNVSINNVSINNVSTKNRVNFVIMYKEKTDPVGLPPPPPLGLYISPTHYHAQAGGHRLISRDRPTNIDSLCLWSTFFYVAALSVRI